MKSRTLCAMAVLLSLARLADPASAQKKSIPAQTQPKARLSEEKKEILRNRELLENLELLKEFEKIRYFDFLASNKRAQGKGNSPDLQPVKSDAKNNK